MRITMQRKAESPCGCWNFVIKFQFSVNHFYSQIICLGAHIQRPNKRNKKFYQMPPNICSILPVQQTAASQLTHFCSFSFTWWHWPSPPRWPDEQGFKRCRRWCREMQGCIVQALHSKCEMWGIFWDGIAAAQCDFRIIESYFIFISLLMSLQVLFQGSRRAGAWRGIARLGFGFLCLFCGVFF